MQTKQSIRQLIRLQRKELSKFQQKYAAKQLTRQLLKLPELTKARFIALYWPNDGEISPLHFCEICRQSNKTIFLPTLKKNGQLSFRKWGNKKKLRNNRYGIAEPLTRESISAKTLDVILLPLVAFDLQGNRLGMGAGYYDKTLAFKQKSLWRKKPLLIGLAHNFQAVENLPFNRWDIPLNMIITNESIIHIKK